ncbi:MAG: hypothetical protein V4671_01690 [Armatimonadota bacterium]
MPLTTKRSSTSSLNRGLCMSSCIVSLLFLIAGGLGYRYYTTLGIDTDVRDSPTTVYYRYYRIRWPGDGTFRIGGGASHYPYGSKSVEPFDFGGRFLQPPRREQPRSLWNRLGFWFIQNRYDDEWTSGNPGLRKPAEFWIGVPGLLPAVVFASFAWLCVRRLKRDVNLIE